MEGKRLIQTLRLKNFLSYGSEGESVQLEPLNVLIGPNASGKSNLIEAIGLLQMIPIQGGLSAAIRRGGGIGEFLWKGEMVDPIAEIGATIYYSKEDHLDGGMLLQHRLHFTRVGQRLEIIDEAIENKLPAPGQDNIDFYYRYQNGHPILKVRNKGGEREERSLRREELNPEESILSQRKDPDQYPEITYLGRQLGKMRLYREWEFPPHKPPRTPQNADYPGDFLSDDAGNLALVLNSLENELRANQLIFENFKKFYDGAGKIVTIIQGGTVQIYVQEKWLNKSVSAIRLSDGTLRYLCLLVILCHPTPPPLICIEEPELGVHPDILPTIAELLIDASKRTQLIITTHSDALVSALTEKPESVLVCERDDAGTHLRRLDPERLKEWLEKYSLGELWRMGEIGGTRW